MATRCRRSSASPRAGAHDRPGPPAVSAVAARLRTAAESGDVAHLDGCYAAGARFAAGLPGRRIVRRDALATLAELWDRPAELVEWDCREHPAGIALWLERRHADGSAQRQRHYVHIDDGAIAAHWIYAAPPRSTAPVVERSALDAFSLVGEVAESAPLVSRGWSGARLERATMTDGRRLIAKRVDPSAEWISPLDRGPRARGDPRPRSRAGRTRRHRRCRRHRDAGRRRLVDRHARRHRRAGRRRDGPRARRPPPHPGCPRRHVDGVRRDPAGLPRVQSPPARRSRPAGGRA